MNTLRVLLFSLGVSSCSISSCFF